jgi:hypothetical protein
MNFLKQRPSDGPPTPIMSSPHRLTQQKQLDKVKVNVKVNV